MDIDGKIKVMQAYRAGIRICVTDKRNGNTGVNQIDTDDPTIQWNWSTFDYEILKFPDKPPI